MRLRLRPLLRALSTDGAAPDAAAAAAAAAAGGTCKLSEGCSCVLMLPAKAAQQSSGNVIQL
jgi:hypothetical protein